MLKCGIVDELKQEIINYKVYPDDSDLADVPAALAKAHPYLKGSGSVSGWERWKSTRGNWNYRKKQKKPEGRHTPAYKVNKAGKGPILPKLFVR